LGFDGTEACLLHAPAVEIIRDDADAAPITPVHDLHGVAAPATQAVRKAVLECASRGVIALARCLQERHERREEQHEIQVQPAEHPIQVHADIHLGADRFLEAGFLHGHEGLVFQDQS
jgi:hypothetical protein